MMLYKKDFITYILESRLCDEFEDYTPQGVVNNAFINYLYKYIRQNTYTGEHDKLLQQLVDLQLTNSNFKDTRIKEYTNRQTYEIIKDSSEISNDMLDNISSVMKSYYNYNYSMISKNKITIDVKFGWLPQNTASWLNLFNDECIIDYYIDNITLRPNTHTILGGPPDSGYVCYRITNIKEYDTIMFLVNKNIMDIEDDIELPKYKVASLLQEIEGSKGATLNRVVEFDLNNFFYELGPYVRNYLSTENSSLIIQVPWQYAVEDYYRVFDVSNLVNIGHNNNTDPNNQDNYFISFTNPFFNEMFTKFDISNLSNFVDLLLSEDYFNDTLIQYLLGDFIWITSDSKLIAYAQNLMNKLYTNTNITINGVWSNELSDLVTKYKIGLSSVLSFSDDVIDKQTENYMIQAFKQMYPNVDPNEKLFKEW